MGAVISRCKNYRYLLERELPDESKKSILFIMLNPSTADATLDDPTIRRCLGFSQKLGTFGKLQVVNLFAYRATNPRELLKASDPYGPDNQKYQKEAINQANLIICAWGAKGSLLSASDKMLQQLSAFSDKTFALDITQQGHPKHPLYVPYDLELKPYKKFKRS